MKRRTHGDGTTVTSTMSKRAHVGDEEGSATMIRNTSVANDVTEARHATRTSAEAALGDGLSKRK